MAFSFIVLTISTFVMLISIMDWGIRAQNSTNTNNNTTKNSSIGTSSNNITIPLNNSVGNISMTPPVVNTKETTNNISKINTTTGVTDSNKLENNIPKAPVLNPPADNNPKTNASTPINDSSNPTSDKKPNKPEENSSNKTEVNDTKSNNTTTKNPPEFQMFSFLTFFSTILQLIYQSLTSKPASDVQVATFVTPSAFINFPPISQLFRRPANSNFRQTEGRDVISSLFSCKEAISTLQKNSERSCQELSLCLVKYCLEKMQDSGGPHERDISSSVNSLLVNIDQFARDIDPSGKMEKHLEKHTCSTYLDKCPEAMNLTIFKDRSLKF